MIVLIIGLGSIAKKHINALKKIDVGVKIYALRSDTKAEQLEDVINVFSLSDCPEVDFIIISNPTSEHYHSIMQVIPLHKPIFIEKPPLYTLENADVVLDAIGKNKILTYTGFNLRFLDCLNFMKKNVQISKVQEVNIYCGSYLPDWRKGVDYKKIYSAIASLGGGVHLDLIHELDYALWLFGKPMNIKKTLRSKSSIKIDAVDYANYILEYEHFAVNIILNYYRRDLKRTCELVFEDVTWNTDLVKNSIVNLNDQTTIFQSNQLIQDTYVDQMSYFYQCIKNKSVSFGSLNESLETLKMAVL